MRLFYTRPWPRHVVWVCAIFMLTYSPAHAFWPFGNDGMDYAIEFHGADAEMREWFEALLLDKKTDANPPQNIEELDIEASALAERTRKALAAKGYMAAIAEPHVDAVSEPPVVHISVEQGVRFPLTSVTIKWPGEPLKDIDMATLGSQVGSPADMKAIETDTVMLYDIISKDSCVLSLSVTPKLQLYSASETARVVFEIEHGVQANFGATHIHGNEHVDNVVIKRAISWKQGKCYQEPRVETTRTNLIQNQLFSTVDVSPADTLDAKGEIAMHIHVNERVARSVSAGVEYSTDAGAGIYGNWEHRNLLGKAEKLNASFNLAQRKQGFTGVFSVPAFLHERQLLVLSSSLKRENIDAYEALTFEGNAGIERRLSRHLKGGLGVGYTLSQTEDALSGKNNYALISLPGFLEYDNRDNLLDPREGVLARISATPYTETIGDGGQFFKTLATGQHYLSSDSLMFKPTLASRLSLGAIYGAKGDSIPADLRYYAGGGGSVRGYSYQSLSPYFQGEPIGGSSLVEATGELRLRFTEDFGGVAFVDAGNAYASTTPDFSEELYVGAGIGARYYSPIGPLRFDIAFPLNGKDIGEDGYQFYVSLGQAF